VDIAPSIVAAVPKKRKTRTVQQALPSFSWVQDIEGNLSLAGIEQYLQLWDVIENFHLENTNDKHVWRFSSNGTFSPSRPTELSLELLLFLDHGKEFGNLGSPQMQNLCMASC
jgi:hypothetical protein